MLAFWGLMRKRSVFCPVVSDMFFSAEWWCSSFLWKTHTLWCTIDVSGSVFDPVGISLHTLHMHWFWVIPLLHPWLLKTQRGPLGSWSGLWILKLVGPRRTASLRCMSSLAAVAHLAGRWLTASKRAQRQRWMCDLCTFASQQGSYS